MIELFKFEFYRLFKSKIAWIIACVMAALPVLAVIALSLIYLYATKHMDSAKISTDTSRYFTWLIISYFYKWVPLVMSLFVPLFVGRDYRDGFIRNKLTAGHTRIQIFTTSVVTKAAYSAILCLIYMIFGLAAIACSPLGININDGEMIVRAMMLLLSAVVTTVLFASLSMVIKNRAVPVILSVVFVMSFNIAGFLATTFAYDHDMIDDYAKVRSKKMERMSGIKDYDDDFDKSKYFNVGWYIGHPLSVLTNAGLPNEFITSTSNVVTDTSDALSYRKNVSRHPFNSLGMSLMSQDVFYLDDKDLKKIDGAIISVEQAELEYNIKSVLWTAVYFGGGYLLFRRKNVF